MGNPAQERVRIQLHQQAQQGDQLLILGKQHGGNFGKMELFLYHNLVCASGHPTGKARVIRDVDFVRSCIRVAKRTMASFDDFPEMANVQVCSLA